VLPGQPSRIVVQPNIAGLVAPSLSRALTCSSPTARPYRSLLFVVVGGGRQRKAAALRELPAIGVLPLFTSLGGELTFRSLADASRARVVDDCGDP